MPKSPIRAAFEFGRHRRLITKFELLKHITGFLKRCALQNLTKGINYSEIDNWKAISENNLFAADTETPQCGLTLFYPCYFLQKKFEHLFYGIKLMLSANIRNFSRE